MTQAWYHIVVIGTELAGLMYAALAARLGYRVCVVGQGGRASAYKHQGFWFLRESELFWGFATSAAVQKVFGELSLGLEMKNRPRPLEPALQVVVGPGMTRGPGPRVRLDLSGHRRHWERDLERELPGALPALDAFEARAGVWKRASDAVIDDGLLLPPRGLRGRAAWKRDTEAIASLLDVATEDPLALEIEDPLHRLVVQAPLVHLMDLLPSPPGLVPMARVWSQMRAGLARFPGGLDGMKQMFLRKLREQSGDYRPDAFATQLVLKRGRVQAVQLGERGEAIGCELVMGNVEPRKILALIPRDQRVDGYHSAMAALEPRGFRLVINIGVDPKVIPQGMAGEVVLVESPTEALSGANCLWVSRPGSDPQEKQLESRPGPGVLRVSALLPARGAMPTLAGVQRTVDGALDATRRLIPWLDESLKVVDVPALAGDDVVDVEAMRPVYAQPLRDTLDAAPFEIETPYKNVLVGGDMAFAGLGFEGAFLSALQALNVTRASVRLPTPAGGRR